MPLGGILKPITVLHSRASKNSGASNLTPSARLALGAIRGYQLLLRPLLTGSCRYLPTCSEYATEAIATYGALRGGWMSLKRVLRCHPFGGAGLDPVP
jgi:putative membrane protein insertion efficiency factor